jgi:hypothetical protein
MDISRNLLLKAVVEYRSNLWGYVGELGDCISAEEFKQMHDEIEELNEIEHFLIVGGPFRWVE